MTDAQAGVAALMGFGLMAVLYAGGGGKWYHAILWFGACIAAAYVWGAFWWLLGA